MPTKFGCVITTAALAVVSIIGLAQPAGAAAAASNAPASGPPPSSNPDYQVTPPAPAAPPAASGDCSANSTDSVEVPETWIHHDGDAITSDSYLTDATWSAWLATVPANSTICFRPGTSAQPGSYLLEESLRISGRSDLWIVGNGARMQQGPAWPMECLDDHCSAFKNSQFLVGASNNGVSKRIEISGFVLSGNNTTGNQTFNTTGWDFRQAMAGLEATSGSTDITFNGNWANETWGDGFEVNGDAQRVAITNNISSYAGRHGVSVVHGSDVLISGNTIINQGLQGIDVEPEPGPYVVQRVQMTGNFFGELDQSHSVREPDDAQIKVFGKPGGTITDYSIDHNTTDVPLNIQVGGAVVKADGWISTKVQRVSITDNTGQLPASGTTTVPPIAAAHVDWLTASGNSDSPTYNDAHDVAINTCLAHINVGGSAPTNSTVTIPGGMTVQNFVEQAFIRSLCRTPDLRNSSDVWTVALDGAWISQGTYTPAYVLTATLKSPEATTGVTTCPTDDSQPCGTGMESFSQKFEALFGRLPQPTDLIPQVIGATQRRCVPAGGSYDSTHVTDPTDTLFNLYNASGQLNGNATANCATWENLSNADFIDLLSMNTLGQQASAVWQTFGQAYLAQGHSRAQLVAVIATNPDVLAAQDAGIKVNLAVIGVLGRAANPTELAFGKAVLAQNGGDITPIVTGLLTSSEFPG